MSERAALGPESSFTCTRLHCTLSAAVCVRRQLVSGGQRTADTWRGEASEYPSCVTERCAQGRGVREALEPGEALAWRGAGPGKRFVSRKKSDSRVQLAARKRLQRAGLLEPPLLDGRPVGRDGDPVFSGSRVSAEALLGA